MTAPKDDNLILKENQLTETQLDIVRVCKEISDLLIAKNKQYGDSALSPIRVFSRAAPAEQIKVRLDDKLSRLIRGKDNLDTEDVVLDLMGYLVLYRIATEREKNNGDTKISSSRS